MSTSSRRTAATRCALAMGWAAVAALLITVTAQAGVLDKQGALRLAGEKPGTRSPAASSYLLRCWQDGKLIIEEQHLEPPASAEAKETARFRLAEPGGKAVVLLDTRNATCLVRPRTAERPSEK